MLRDLSVGATARLHSQGHAYLHSIANSTFLTYNKFKSCIARGGEGGLTIAMGSVVGSLVQRCQDSEENKKKNARAGGRVYENLAS